LRGHAIPPAVRPSLPALWGVRGVVAVPHLDVVPRHRHMSVAVAFCARVPFAGTRFTVA